MLFSLALFEQLESGQVGLQVTSKAKDALCLAWWTAGQCMAHGLSTFEQDQAKAIRLFRMVAEHGDSPLESAQLALGGLYESGRYGLVVNKDEAVRYYRLAAHRGGVNARMRVLLFDALAWSGLDVTVDFALLFAAMQMMLLGLAAGLGSYFSSAWNLYARLPS
jgi:hypothetical protein